MQIKKLAEEMDFEMLLGIVDCSWVIVEPISAFKEAVGEEDGHPERSGILMTGDIPSMIDCSGIKSATMLYRHSAVKLCKNKDL